MGDQDGFDSAESEFAKRWLCWCRSSKKLKCTEAEVPSGVLPQGYRGILIDVKVHGAGPDDKLYASDAELRDKVARGNCVLELQFKEKVHYIFILFALKKFSGGMGDEDDSPCYQNMWQNYFLQKKETAVKVVCTKKANGEAAHASCRKLFGQNYFCLGSKNVHLLAKSKDDVEKYRDSRYMVAKTVAETFFRQIIDNCDMKKDNIEKLVDYMDNTKSTMVCEILQPEYQHIECLSHLSEPIMLFICWTSYTAIDQRITLCLQSPELSIKEAREFGLDTVDYEIINAAESEEYMANVRTKFGYEGRVLYFLDEDDNIIGVLKKKTSWYIILRAIREKAAHFFSKKDNSSLSERKRRVAKRIAEIQSWTGFSDSDLQCWQKLGTAFIEWLVKEKGQKSIGIRSQFPSLWHSFLESNADMMKIYSELQSNS